MTDHDRIIGRLEEFHSWELSEHKEIKDRLSEINHKIEELNEFKWKIIGVTAFCSFFCSGIMVTLIQYWKMVKV